MYKSLLVKYLELKFNKPIEQLLYGDYFNTDVSLRTLAKKYEITLKTAQKLIKKYQIPKIKMKIKGEDENE